MTTGTARSRPTFHVVVPIRHPASVTSPEGQQAGLRDLLGSLAAQRDRRVACHFAVNPDQRLPPLPPFARRVDIDLPPNDALAAATTRDALYQAVRQDRGARVAAAVAGLAPDDLIMVMDDDDLVHRDLVAFALGAPPGTAFVIDKGYGWPAPYDEAFEIDQFHRTCGTSLIIPAARYKLFRRARGERFDDLEVASELGSHRQIVDSDHRAGRPFARVPFRAAIYRLGHPNASQRAVERLAENRRIYRDPATFALALRRLAGRGRSRLAALRPARLLDESRSHPRRRIPIERLRDDFFGGADPQPDA